MKNLLKGLCVCLMAIITFGLVVFCAPAKNAYADDTNPTESAYSRITISDMVGMNTSGATYDAATGNITSMVSGGRFSSGQRYENVEVSSTLRFETTGNVTFTIRGKGADYASSATWSESAGYMVRWYPHGQFDFVKNGVAIQSSFWGPLPAMAVDTDYQVVFKTVNMSDDSVQVLLTINGLTVVNHNDAINDNGTPDEPSDDIYPITGAGCYAMSSDGATFSVTGNKKTVPIVNLSDIADPIMSSNFAGATVDENGVVTATGTGAAGFSGVGYTFYNDGAGYGYKAAVTPKAAAGRLVFTIGSYKTNAHEMNRPTEYSTGDGGWAWDDPGYVVYWSSNGQRHFARGNDNVKLLDYAWNCPSFVADTTYNIEYSMIPFEDGSVKITFKINDNIVLNYLDIPQYDAEGNVTNEPAKLVHGAGSLGRVTNALLLTVSVEATFAPIDPISVAEKTVITNDLGQGVSSTSEFDRNGAVSLLQGALPAGWNANIKNTVIRFSTTFTAMAAGNPNITYMINYKGSNLDQPGGGDWTTKGYGFGLYANGMTSLLDGGVALFDGWNPYAFPGVGLSLNTKYNFEIGTQTDGATYTRVWLKINNVCVFNYLDTTSPVTDGGWFSIYNGGGYVGNMLPYGIEIPTIATDIAQDAKADVNTPFTMSYSLTNVADTDVVTYYVDTQKSTATANVVGDKITPLTEGNLVVYACVNGIYSEDITVEVESSACAVVTNLPTTPIIVGGEKVSIDGKMSDDSAIESKSFRVENISGRATINATTGEITPVAAGTIRVYAIINGLESEGYILTIIPQIEIKNATAMAKGGTLDNLGYIANCELPNEMITATYELVEGGQYVEFNATTGSVRALAIGIFGVRVTITGETFQAISPVCRISIEEPIIVVNNGPVKDMYVGQERLIYPHISQGGIAITEVGLVVTHGEKLISTEVVEHEGKKYIKITALNNGVVRIKPIVNGVEGVQESEFAIEKLVPTIIVNNVCVGRAQTLSVIFNSNEFEYNDIVYSIVEGQDIASLDGNILTGNKVGSVTIKAVVDGEYIAQATIEITDKVIFKGIVDGQDILVGSKVQLDYYVYDQEGTVKTVEYVLVEGHTFAVLTKDGLLVAKKIGQIKVQVIVDGVASNVLTLHIYQNTSKLVGYIVLGAILVLAILGGAATGIVYGVKKMKLKKAASQEAAEEPKQSKKSAKQSSKKAEKSTEATQSKVEEKPVENQEKPKEEKKTSKKEASSTKTQKSETKKEELPNKTKSTNKNKNTKKGNK